MKRHIATILVLSASLLSLAGCDIKKGGELTLALHSKAFSIGLRTSNAPSLDTYHSSKEGDVPYVSLSQYCDALGESLAFNPYSVTYKDGVYSVYGAETEEEGAKKNEYFRFDVSKNSVTFLPTASRQFRFYETIDPYAEGTSDTTVIDKDKITREKLWDSKTVELGKYDFKLREQSGQLLAPFGLFQSIFSTTAMPDGINPFVFNGRDYYTIETNSGNRASCLSSELRFRYADQALLALSMQVTDAYIEPNLSFAPVTAGKGEKYRFESEKVITAAFTAPGESEPRKSIPDFKIRLVLSEDGKGKYGFLDANSGEPIEIESLGIKTREVQFLEEDEALLVAILPIKEGTQGEMMRINKKDTFYLKNERSKEYAVYDYNLTRLYFGEFYGLHNRNYSFDTLIAPYKDKICSTSYRDYNEGMSRFLYEAVDDGHTSVTGYSLFGDQKLDAAEKTKLRDCFGPRLRSLVNYQSLLKGYRYSAKINEGCQIVGDTAYLAFDSFKSSEGKVTNYTAEPNTYASSNTIAFAYTSLKEIATKHNEVKRIVYDLTCNTGGAVSAMPFLLATMTDDPSITTFNYYTGEKINAHYKVDLNGDGVFGGKDDTYKGKYQFYVLTSPLSFSCGNALPGLAKANRCATIIGARSAGGGAMVDQVATASGFTYCSSSRLVFTTIDQKGDAVENDGGIPVDVDIPIDIFYNRELINERLNKLNK